MDDFYMLKVLEYIEAHLKDDRQGVLDNLTLAKIAGYSEYHFARLFREYVGLTPADYIRKRRISEIVRSMDIGNRPMSDIAFEYGFNSKENFTRAFKKEHGILPTEFRTAQCSLRLYAPFRKEAVPLLPEVSLTYLQSFLLVAFPFDEGDPPKFWNQYNASCLSVRLSGGSKVRDYGAMIWNPKHRKLDYFIGIRADEAKGDLTGTEQLEISEGLYAVFDTPLSTQHDFVGTIRGVWDWIYGVWLPQNGYRRAQGFELECYVESSKQYSEQIYVPIRKEK